MSETPRKTARALAADIRAGRIGVAELLEEHLRVIAAKDPELHAFADLTARQARVTARLYDARAVKARKTSGVARWPTFFGVPSGIKDDSPMRMSFLRVGSRALSFVFSPFDGMLASAVRRGGFVLTGKLSTSEMTILPYVHPETHPPTRNPLDPTRYSGGSSGGSSCAVASGMLPIAPGSDGAGSIRIPSSFCGLFGFKASRGAVPHPYARLDIAGLSTTGPLAQDARDAALLLDVIAGDSFHADPLRPGSFASACEEPVAKGAKIKLCKTSPLVTIDPEVDACVMRAARALEAMGHVIEETGPMDADVEGFLPLMQKITANAPLLPFSDPWLEPTTKWMRDEGKRHDKKTVLAQAKKLEARMLEQFGDADFWLLPTVALLPPKVGSFTGLTGEETLRAVTPLGAFTAPFNVSGQPAVSVPAGRSREGVPIGVQLVAARGADRKLFALATKLEEALVQ